ncbi:MAG TPA: alpha/beta hydrolase [Acidobacteriota bacterium]|nr:alpha/beta hydrolase [Acidobacteriota bacterium]
MHVVGRGHGAPTVVFDSVIGASSLGWVFVQPEVAKVTSTFAYDRAGYGWSDPGVTPRTTRQLVAELHAVLSASGTPGPYILVGASFGGCIARLYTFQYPSDVAALVLVDPAHEDQTARMPESTQPPMVTFRLFQAASRLGVLRLANLPVDIAGMNVLPETAQQQAAAVGFRTDAVDAIVSETAVVEQSFAEVRKARATMGATPLGDRPLIVLTHKEDRVLHGDEAVAYDVWVKLHKELAAESTRGRQVFVEHSGHFIGVNQPGSVIDAIQTVVEDVRAMRP